MNRLELQPDQVLSTHDFPVHNEHILKMYFHMARHSPTLVPPTPVWPITLGMPLLPSSHPLSGTHNSAIKAYLEKNQQITHLMLDGSHKTTALTLTGNPITALVIGTNAEIRQAFTLVESGELLGFCNPETIEETLLDSANHLSQSTNFETVGSKTRKMISEKVIPTYMINYFRSLSSSNP